MRRYQIKTYPSYIINLDTNKLEFGEDPAIIIKPKCFKANTKPFQVLEYVLEQTVSPSNKLPTKKIAVQVWENDSSSSINSCHNATSKINKEIRNILKADELYRLIWHDDTMDTYLVDAFPVSDDFIPLHNLSVRVLFDAIIRAIFSSGDNLSTEIDEIICSSNRDVFEFLISKMISDGEEVDKEQIVMGHVENYTPLLNFYKSFMLSLKNDNWDKACDSIINNIENNISNMINLIGYKKGFNKKPETDEEQDKAKQLGKILFGDWNKKLLDYFVSDAGWNLVHRVIPVFQKEWLTGGGSTAQGLQMS